MISNSMSDYNYSTLGARDEYGQEAESEIQGTIKLAIYSLTNTLGANIKYKDATYLALTHNKTINDSFVIHYGNEKLKVLYTIPAGRYNQVFLGEM